MEPRVFRPRGTGFEIVMPSRLPILFTAVVFAALLCASRALAQPPVTDGWEQSRWRFGPFAVTPKFELKNLGWDTNVFAEVEDPKSDFTVTAAVPVDWWFRFGRGRLHGVSTVEGVYFATYSNQRGYNPRHEVTLLFPLNRVTPYIGGTYLSTNERPGFEITERIRRTETGANGGLFLRLSSKLGLDLKGRETTYRYDEGETTNYSETLDRRTEIYGAQARYRVTSLTTLTFLADAVRERYTGTPERDNDGYRLLPGVEFGEHALITGKAELGYRSLSTPAPGVPDFSGFVGSAELSYVFRSMTRFTVGASRDIYFSYSNIEPFYIQPGFTLSITQQVSGPWDVQARGAWYRLDYQRVDVPGPEQLPERVDEYQTWGGGIGYRVGREIRVSVNVDGYQRQSILNGQDYDGIRAGMAVTYAPK
jgi:hypothetical protein